MIYFLYINMTLYILSSTSHLYNIIYTGYSSRTIKLTLPIHTHLDIQTGTCAIQFWGVGITQLLHERDSRM